MKRILLALALLMATDKVSASDEIKSVGLILGILVVAGSFASDNYQKSKLQKTARLNPDQKDICKSEDLNGSTNTTTFFGTCSTVGLFIHRFCNPSPILTIAAVALTLGSAIVTYTYRTAIEEDVHRERERSERRKQLAAALEREKSQRNKRNGDEEESNTGSSRPFRQSNVRTA